LGVERIIFILVTLAVYLVRQQEQSKILTFQGMAPNEQDVSCVAVAWWLGRFRVQRNTLDQDIILIFGRKVGTEVYPEGNAADEVSEQ